MTDPVDLKLTWRMQVPMLVALIERGDAAGREFAVQELNRLADIVDKRIGDLKRLLEQRAPCPDCGIRGGHAYGCPFTTHKGDE